MCLLSVWSLVTTAVGTGKRGQAQDAVYGSSQPSGGCVYRQRTRHPQENRVLFSCVGQAMQIALFHQGWVAAT